MRLEQPVKSQVVKLFLVLFAVRVGAKFRRSGQALQERKLLAAMKTLHECFIGLRRPFLKP